MMRIPFMLGFALLACRSFGGTPSPVDPTTIWNREELYRTPRIWEWGRGTFGNEVMPVWIEGVPFRGKPTRAFAFYGVPESASKDRKVPGIVLVHGGAGTAYPEWVRLWVKRGYAAVAVNNCGQLPIREIDGKGWMNSPYGGPNGWGRVDQADEPLTDQWTYHAVADTMLAHSFLRSLACVDSSNIGVTGVSWGGFLTCILAAADDRFAYAVPVYGCGFNYEEGGLVDKCEGVGKWAALWDPVVFLPYAKIPFLWVDGTNDFAFSLDRVLRSAALACGSQAFCTRLRMPHGHGGPAESPAEILAFADHFAHGGRDLLRFSDVRIADGRLTAVFAANGREPVRGELLWTEDGADVKWTERNWQIRPLAENEWTATSVSVTLPERIHQAIVNLIDADGLIFSSSMATLDGK